MSKPLILPTALFAPISYYVCLLRANQSKQEVWIEQNDRFLKQTVRNRYRVYSPQGPILLTVPLQSKSSKTLINDIKIDYSMPWQKEHLRTLQAAYSSTPFYEHYMHKLEKVFSSEFSSLVELNKWVFETINEELNLNLKWKYSTEYLEFENACDYRNQRSDEFSEIHETYYQLLFDKGKPFAPNLSILDLMFNLGPESRLWLNESLERLRK